MNLKKKIVPDKMASWTVVFLTILCILALGNFPAHSATEALDDQTIQALEEERRNMKQVLESIKLEMQEVLARIAESMAEERNRLKQELLNLKNETESIRGNILKALKAEQSLMRQDSQALADELRQYKADTDAIQSQLDVALESAVFEREEEAKDLQQAFEESKKVAKSSKKETTKILKKSRAAAKTRKQEQKKVIAKSSRDVMSSLKKSRKNLFQSAKLDQAKARAGHREMFAELDKTGDKSRSSRRFSKLSRTRTVKTRKAVAEKRRVSRRREEKERATAAFSRRAGIFKKKSGKKRAQKPGESAGKEGETRIGYSEARLGESASARAKVLAGSLRGEARKSKRQSLDRSAGLSRGFEGKGRDRGDSKFARLDARKIRKSLLNEDGKKTRKERKFFRGKKSGKDLKGTKFKKRKRVRDDNLLDEKRKRKRIKEQRLASLKKKRQKFGEEDPLGKRRKFDEEEKKKKLARDKGKDERKAPVGQSEFLAGEEGLDEAIEELENFYDEEGNPRVASDDPYRKEKIHLMKLSGAIKRLKKSLAENAGDQTETLKKLGSIYLESFEYLNALDPQSQLEMIQFADISGTVLGSRELSLLSYQMVLKFKPWDGESNLAMSGLHEETGEALEARIYANRAERGFKMAKKPEDAKRAGDAARRIAQKFSGVSRENKTQNF